MGTSSSQEARKLKGNQVADQSTAPKPQVFEHKSRDSFDALKKQGIDRMLRDAARYDAAMLKTIERKKKLEKERENNNNNMGTSSSQEARELTPQADEQLTANVLSQLEIKKQRERAGKIQNIRKNRLKQEENMRKLRSKEIERLNEEAKQRDEREEKVRQRTRDGEPRRSTSSTVPSANTRRGSGFGW